MNRREFLERAGWLPLSALLASFRLAGAEVEASPRPELGRPGPRRKGERLQRSGRSAAGFEPASALSNRLRTCWQANGESAGAWLEIGFGEPKPVREIWVLATPRTSGIVGEDPYILMFPREPLRLAPRKVRISLSNGANHPAELPVQRLPNRYLAQN